MGTNLTIAIPFFGDDPTPLLEGLTRCDAHGVEICLWDDGSPDRAITERLRTRKECGPHPLRLFESPVNKGRAATRNYLTSVARGVHILFLDADMRIHDEDFLLIWQDAIDRHPEAILFGGFLPPADTGGMPVSLHAAMAATADCPPAAQRNRSPARYVYTSNLSAPKTLFEACPFADSFDGWGWEDVEWGLRAAAHSAVVHIENAAIHDDIVDDEELIARFATSAQNFARLAAAHPDAVRDMPVWRAAQLFRHLAPVRAMAPLFAGASRRRSLPMPMRLVALKLWRASHYGAAL